MCRTKRPDPRDGKAEDAADAGVGGGGVIFDEESISRADAAVVALHANYAEWISVDIAALRAAYARAVAEPSARGERILFIRRQSHDIKGHGSSFGYPLMTSIGASLSDYCREMEPIGDVDLAMIEMFIEAMKSVVDDRLAGDGGARGATLTRELGQVERLCRGLREAANEIGLAAE